MQLGEVKTQALRHVVAGDLGRALGLYAAIVRAVPSDLDARTKVADLLVAAGLQDLAKRVYAAVAFYDLRLGRPLHALVCCQALAELGASVASIVDALPALYGAGSPRLARGRVGARLAPPDPATEISVPGDAPDLAAAAEIAAGLASCTTDLTTFPEMFPPVPLLSDLPADAFGRVARVARVHRLRHGTAIIREGEPGHSFFLVAGGQVRVFKTDALGRETELAQLGEGALFGELALVAAQPRSSSVSVVKEADSIELGTDALVAAADDLVSLAQALSRFTRDRLIRNLLATSPLFQPFSPQQRIDLARRFTGHDVAPGTDLIRQGEPGRGLFVVLSGEVEVLRGEAPLETTLATLRPGELFGEISLVRGIPTIATVRAARPTTVLFLAREYFDRLIGALPEIRAFFEGLTEGRLAQAARAEEAPELVPEDELVIL